MFETQVTVVGNLVTDVDKHRLSDGTAVANFRVASSERRYDRAGGTWVDGNSLYIDVRCWRGLAENSGASLVKGDPVVVAGHIYTRSYEHQGQRRSTPTLEAHSVAADLARCTVVLTRTGRGAAVADRLIAQAAADDVAATSGPEGTRPELVAVAPGDEG
jgi:single-strand DNA-binding protein